MTLLEFFAATAVAWIVTAEFWRLAPKWRLQSMIMLVIVLMIVLTVRTVHVFVRRQGRGGFGL